MERAILTEGDIWKHWKKTWVASDLPHNRTLEWIIIERRVTRVSGKEMSHTFRAKLEWKTSQYPSHTMWAVKFVVGQNWDHERNVAEADVKEYGWKIFDS